VLGAEARLFPLMKLGEAKVLGDVRAAKSWEGEGGEEKREKDGEKGEIGKGGRTNKFGAVRRCFLILVDLGFIFLLFRTTPTERGQLRGVHVRLSREQCTDSAPAKSTEKSCVVKSVRIAGDTDL